MRVGCVPLLFVALFLARQLSVLVRCTGRYIFFLNPDNHRLSYLGLYENLKRAYESETEN